MAEYLWTKEDLVCNEFMFHGIALLSQVSYLMYLSAYKLLFINFIC